MKRRLAQAFLLACVLACAAWPAPKAQAAPLYDADTGASEQDVLRFLGQLQDSQGSGLVPLYEGAQDTTTYSNAMAAIAFVAGGETGRARRVFDVFAGRTDACPACACQGAFQQFRLASTGLPNPDADPNDFWIGDNAWLLAALKYHRQATGDSRYDALIGRLTAWFVCLEALTPDPGIYSGFRKNGDLMDFRHPEGSIDVYGALRGSGVEAVRASVKQWLDAAVWVSRGDCYDIGYMNWPAQVTHNLPTDNVSWGYLALGPAYRCLLSYAEGLTARTQDPYLIEVFDSHTDSYWTAARQNDDPAIAVDLARAQHGEGHDLVVQYTWKPDDEWFLFHRERDIDLVVTPGFVYHFWLRGDGSGNRFEVKLQNKTGEWYWYFLPLDFDGWRKVEVRYDQFVDFGNNNGVRLAEVTKIEYAVNNQSHQAAVNSELRIGRTWYQDSGAPRRYGVDGFAAFETEQNWLFVEGTGQMAAAYCVAGKTAEWQHYLGELTGLLQPASAGDAQGLPNFLTGSINRPIIESVASSWYIAAAHCLNPFSFAESRDVYLPLILRSLPRE